MRPYLHPAGVSEPNGLKNPRMGILGGRASRRALTYKPYHPLNGGTDGIKKTPDKEVYCGRERARTSEPYHPLNGGTDGIKKTPDKEVYCGRERARTSEPHGCEPCALTN
jgi:hypothetical protein